MTIPSVSAPVTPPQTPPTPPSTPPVSKVTHAVATPLHLLAQTMASSSSTPMSTTGTDLLIPDLAAFGEDFGASNGKRTLCPDTPLRKKKIVPRQPQFSSSPATTTAQSKSPHPPQATPPLSKTSPFSPSHLFSSPSSKPPGALAPLRRPTMCQPLLIQTPPTGLEFVYKGLKFQLTKKLGAGNFSEAWTFQGNTRLHPKIPNEELVFKKYSEATLAKGNGVLVYLKNSLSQYDQLVRDKIIPVAEIINRDSCIEDGYFIQRRTKPCDWKKEGVTIKQWFAYCWKNGIPADLKPDNIGLVDGQMVLRDFYELETGNNREEFNAMLPNLLREFALGSETIFKFLDPRPQSVTTLLMPPSSPTAAKLPSPVAKNNV